MAFNFSSKSFENQKPWKRSWLLFFILLLISFLMLTIQKRRNLRFDLISMPIQTIVGPLQGATMTVLREINNTFQGYLFLVGLKQENDSLRAKIEFLEGKVIEAQEALAANSRLKSLLQFKQQIMPQALACEIIGQDAVNWTRVIILDKGSKKGVSKNCPVITPLGIVGKVIQILPWTCQVQLIIDANSGVSGIVQRTRALGIVTGHGQNICTMEYLPQDCEIRVGDRVLTSGLDDVFPKGLCIGNISKVNQASSGLFQYVELEPAVKLSTLEEVLLLVKNF